LSIAAQPLTRLTEFDPEDEYRPEPEPEALPPAWLDGSTRVGIHTSIAGGHRNALETARKGITVNCVAPGFIETEMVGAIPEQILQGIVDRVPVHRLGRPEEVARVVRFLLEDESAYITGAVYTVNGGLF